MAYGDRNYDNDQLALYNRYDIKFKIKINYDENKIKTVSFTQKEWTKLNENMCKKQEPQIAFLTGQKNNLTVIDLDVVNVNKENDKKYKNMKEDEYGIGLFKKPMEIDSFDELEDCIVVQTPSGGIHIYTDYMPELENKNGILPKIDIKNDGGCIFFTTDHKVLHYSEYTDAMVSRVFNDAVKNYNYVINQDLNFDNINQKYYDLLNLLPNSYFNDFDKWVQPSYALYNAMDCPKDQGLNTFCRCVSERSLGYNEQEAIRVWCMEFKWN